MKKTVLKFVVAAALVSAVATPAHAIRWCCQLNGAPWYAGIMGLILSE
ncbi:MAG: hypothetical protein RL030_1758 [Pseudomonadota bacterium]|jgi:hypothetical protein